MAVALAIIAILLVAFATVIVFGASRRRSTTGGLSRETRRRDTSRAPAEGEPSASTELEAAGRERADETRARAGGPPAVRPGGEVVRYEPVDEEEIGLSRRQFLNRGVFTAIAFSVASFGATMLAFLWPTASGGFGGKVTAGKLGDILDEISRKKAPFYVPDARTYVQPYPRSALLAAKKLYKDPLVLKGMEQGVVALYQKCVHLGCRVPWCQSSQWFECPCHGSKYNRIGEKKAGPAPRGLDRWPVTIEGGVLTIDTSGQPVLGPPIGTNTTGQQQEGPLCV